MPLFPFINVGDILTFLLSTPLAFAGTIVGVILTGLFLLVKIIQSMEWSVKEPVNKLIGEIGSVTEEIAADKPGKIMVYGEIWPAVYKTQHDTPIDTGKKVKVVSINPQLNQLIVELL